MNTEMLSLVREVGLLLDEAEIISGTSGELEEYVVSAETVNDLRMSFIALKKACVVQIKEKKEEQKGDARDA